ncbi:hypothetical protein M514_22808 [Trichuris suis]|uniref:Uncharacterized protein n=1 Tax=Trichuris suis TaxID=68888 RepID=A0A085N6J5_9BILA|nr:hypothetical protein M514_22808 [Trichuris suis]
MNMCILFRKLLQGIGPTVLSLCHYKEWNRGTDIETQPASNSFNFSPKPAQYGMIAAVLRSVRFASRTAISSASGSPRSLCQGDSANAVLFTRIDPHTAKRLPSLRSGASGNGPVT